MQTLAAFGIFDHEVRYQSLTMHVEPSVTIISREEKVVNNLQVISGTMKHNGQAATGLCIT